MTATLSLSMIVKDEGRVLSPLLQRAAEFCDELVVVDTGSTDDTKKVAEQAGARVLDFPWVDDFSAARNASLEACTSDWVMWLDADDRITHAVTQAYLDVKRHLLTDDLDAVYAPYRYHHDPVTGVCTNSTQRERLVRRVPGLHWEGVVHEVLIVPGDRTASRDDLYIEHRPSAEKANKPAHRNLTILEKAVDRGDRSARTLFYYANELKDNGWATRALDVYREYISLPSPWWEAYHALISMSQCSVQLGHDDKAVNYLHEAIKRDPSRAEAYMHLGRRHYDRHEWELAIPYFGAATVCRRPVTGFICETDYSWGPWDYLSVCLANVGRHADAVVANGRSLALGNPDRERLEANLQWSV